MNSNKLPEDVEFDDEEFREFLNESGSDSLSIVTVPANQDLVRFFELPADGHVIITITKNKLGPGYHKGTDNFNDSLDDLFARLEQRGYPDLKREDALAFLEEKFRTAEFLKRSEGSLQKARSKKQRPPYLDVTLQRVAGTFPTTEKRNWGEVVTNIVRRYESHRREMLNSPMQKEPAMGASKDDANEPMAMQVDPGTEVDQRSTHKRKKSEENDSRMYTTDNVNIPAMDRVLPRTTADELRFANKTTVDALGGTNSPFFKFLIALKNGESTSALLKILQEEPTIATVKDPKGKLALHHAVSFSHTQVGVVEKLLELHPDSVKARTKRGDTPLHLACMYGVHMDILEVLYDRYPEAVDICDNGGFSPWYLAYSFSRPGPIKFLTAKKAQRPAAFDTGKVTDNPLTFAQNNNRWGHRL